ncbi:restriction endonuclease subunit S [Streptomyces sp. WAC06614]|uniref:restriction endonuclease subunit S n=1 Tax=Streptomyces sp. WAC06614 TaxID=2487416 RepID=UPI000F78E341|nr:restriction endonuclease subunit S [Streptomyces sp. WAC06614]RSS82931.1 restriction endonuclease subunit S [Streptomyces sp. WAC06614]
MSELPPGWLRAPLADFAEVRLGRQRSPKNHTGTNMRPYLRAANVGWHGLLLDDVKTMHFTDDEAEVYRLRRGDIVVGEASGSAGEVGKPALWNDEIEDCCLQNTLIRVRARRVEPRYLLHYLRYEALRGAFAADARGVGIHHLGATRLARWPISIPPLAEQHRLVAELEDRLSQLDAVASSLNTVVARMSRLRTRITDFATTGGLAPAQRAAAHLAPAGIDDGELPPLPRNWRWARLGQIAAVVGGVTKDTKKQNDPSYVEVPYLRVANVQRGRLELSDVSTIKVAPAKADQLYLKHGDVLLNEGGDRDKLGRGWIWEEQIPQCIHQNHVFRARVDQEVLHPKLLAWHANGFGQRWCERNGKQSVNLASISLSKIRMLPVAIPPQDVQQQLVSEIEERLKMADVVHSSATAGLERLAAIRKALLRTAFSGRLVPQVPEDEPASVLLEAARADVPTPLAGARKRVASRRTPKKEVQETLL